MKEQARLVVAALEGGINSMGRFRWDRQDRIQSLIDELAHFTNAVAVGVADKGGHILAHAGRDGLYRSDAPDESVTDEHYQYKRDSLIRKGILSESPDPSEKKHQKSHDIQQVFIFVVLDRAKVKAEITRDLILRLSLGGALLVISLVLWVLVRQTRESSRLAYEL